LLFTLFFLFTDGRQLYGRFYDAIPLEADHKARLCQHLNRTTIAVVRRSLFAALGQGIIAGVTYAMLGLPFPAFLGAMSALLALLPFGGTAFIWGPLVIWLLAAGSVAKAATPAHGHPLDRLHGQCDLLLDHRVNSTLAGPSSIFRLSRRHRLFRLDRPVHRSYALGRRDRRVPNL
jgi:hypothetical protein